MRVASLALAACLVLSGVGRGATIDVAGTPGVDGLDAVAPNPATSGTPGEDALALALGAEADNSATATAGKGGRGGNPYYPDLTTPGNAAVGGSAEARAAGISAAGAATASATAIGGAGGAGGQSLPYAPASPGANGGTALADASTQSAGAASATAQAQGGAGGAGGIYVTGVDPFAGFIFSRKPNGIAGTANAHASATSGLGDASAGATGAGRAAQARSEAFSTSGAAHSDATAAGQGAAASSGTEVAIANAFAHGAGPTEAIALARGNRETTTINLYTFGGGAAAASARAESDTDSATARATQIGGDAPPAVPPLLTGYPPSGGGTGVDSIMQDAVSGRAAGRLTLYQEAVGSPAHIDYDGGDATSVLHAVNEGGGALTAEVVARAGATDISCLSRGGIPPQCSFGLGGTALATVDALGSAGKDVYAAAHATGGAGAQTYHQYGSTTVNSGAATADATARGNGSLSAHSDATTDFGGLAHAGANALGAGAIAGVHAQLELRASNPSPGSTGFHSSAGADVSLGPVIAVAPALEANGANARLLAAPGAASVTASLAGNPNALAAAAGREVLALGFIDARTAVGTVPPYVPDEMSVQGSLALDFANHSAAATPIAVAFLDPSALGASADQLVLSIELDGATAFSATFASVDQILAALDDVVVELGSVAPGASAHLALSFTMNLVRGAAPARFALDMAFLSAPVPEPGLALLMLVALASWSAHRYSAIS